MSRAAVKPARRSACRFWTAMMVARSRVVPFSGVLNMCVCASMSPGRTVASLRSITAAPAGALTRDSGPTSRMRSPCTRTTCFVSIVPASLSNSRPARMAVTRVLAGGHCSVPPSGATHGRRADVAPRAGQLLPWRRRRRLRAQQGARRHEHGHRQHDAITSGHGARLLVEAEGSGTRATYRAVVDRDRQRAALFDGSVGSGFWPRPRVSLYAWWHAAQASERSPVASDTASWLLVCEAW